MIPEIPGKSVDRGYQHYLRSRLASLFGISPEKFPGAQPISFARHHIRDELESENYFVSEKADGIRCVLFTMLDDYREPQTYLIDRKNTYYQIKLGLPHPDNPREWQSDTVLDGELVLDVEKDGTTQLYFLLFDCMVYMGNSIIEKPYHKRLGHLTEHIMNPYKRRLKEDRAFAASQIFKMDLKKLELSYGMDRVFEEMANLKHKSDGVIFTSKDAPYTIGTCDKMLKWKPSDENTVDFRLDVRGDTKRSPEYMLQIWDGGNLHTDFCTLNLEPELREEWLKDPPHGRIVECRYDPEWLGHWRFMRFRDDKDKGNHRSVYKKIMKSIEDGVDKETLKSHIKTIRDRWKEREQREREMRHRRERDRYNREAEYERDYRR
ncbi:Dcp1p-Dcp2p decapping enzyme complex alpha subunit [Chytridiales sp. JEL 0842]|nr:Dcp1p-Dcp2p decapping enzyme complex alpha subunit [Chytridiales sp. JEL 0842]